MRILVLSPNLPYPPNAGSKARAFNILRELSQTNDIVLACLTDECMDPHSSDVLNAFCESVHIQPLHSRSAPRRLQWLFHRDPYHARMFWVAGFRDYVADLLIQMPFDVIYCNYLYMAQYLGSRPPQQLWVIDQHNSDYLMWQRLKEQDPNFAIRLIAKHNFSKTRYYEDKHYRKFNICFAVSEEDALATARIAPSTLRVHVAPNGVDTEFFKPSPQNVEEPQSILFFGTMSARMNSDAAVHFARNVFPRVLSVRPNARFLIVGRTPPREVRSLSSLPGIIVTGQVPDIRPYLAMATLVVSPVRLGAGTKLKVLEAMSMGKAVVASVQSCTGLLLKNGYDIAMASDDSSFAQKVLWLLSDRHARTQMGCAARATVGREYGWKSIVGSINRVLNDSVAELRRYGARTS